MWINFGSGFHAPEHSALIVMPLSNILADGPGYLCRRSWLPLKLPWEIVCLMSPLDLARLH